MKVSVSIPTYNQGSYIEETIRSVLKQELKPDEIIVSNDCSTDNTQEVLEKLEKEIPFLKVINQPVNLGMAENTNYSLRAATGEVVVKLDSDDKLLPGYIRQLHHLLKKYPQAGYAHADVQEIDEQGQLVKERRLTRRTGFVDAEGALKASVKGYKVAANIIMFRKKALEDAGFIRSKVNFAEDFYLSVNIADAGWGNAYCNEVLSCYRVWNDAGQVRIKRKLVEVKGLTAVFEEALTPAFAKRNWSKHILDDARKNFAISQAVSLGWNVFSDTEKKDLKEAILKLDASVKTQTSIKAYFAGKQPADGLLHRISNKAKQIAKPIYKQLIK